MMYRIVDSENADWGAGLVGVGDVDGDGAGDLLIGDRTNWDVDWNAGVAYLLSSAAMDVADRADGRRDGVVDIREIAGLPGSYRLDGSRTALTGYRVKGIGDVDGDGLAEIIVDSAEVYGAGRIHLISPIQLAAADAADGVVDGVLPVGAATGLGASYRFVGATLGGAGDIDGDGLPDLLIGRSDYDQNDPTLEGTVWLIPASGLAAADAADGTLDGLVASDNTLAQGGYKFFSRVRGDEFGGAASGVGDVDGDGVDDFVIVAPGIVETWYFPRTNGKVYIVPTAGLDDLDAADGVLDRTIADVDLAGRGGTYTIHGNAPYMSVTRAGDVDGDGLADLLIAADWLDDDHPVRVRVHLATAASLAAADAADGVVDGDISLLNLGVAEGAYHFTSIQAGPSRGVSMATAGDVDGDGRDDFFLGVGLGELTSERLDEGVVYLLLAADLAAIDAADGAADGFIRLENAGAIGGTYRFVGGEAGAKASGGRLAGDLDGDGLEEIAINTSGSFRLISLAELAVADARDGTVDRVIDLSGLDIPNTPPVAADDFGVGFATTADAVVDTPSVLANDVDDDALRVSAIDTSGLLGQVTLRPGGVIRYDPSGAFDALKPGETATDSFVYTVADGRGGTDEAMVTIEVAGVNDAPEFGLGLVFADDFERADGDPGAPWTVLNAAAVIENGRLKMQSTSAPRDALVAAFDGAPEIGDFLLEVEVDPEEALNWTQASIMVWTDGFYRGSDGLRGAAYTIDLTNQSGGGRGSGPINLITLFKAVDGSHEVLQQFAIPEQTSPFGVSVSGSDGALTVAIDGDVVLTNVDAEADALGHGGIGLHTIWEARTFFDDVKLYAERDAAEPWWIEETLAVGTLVAGVKATDADGDALVYTLSGGLDVDGDGEAPFAIDAATGEITVADADDIDHEATEGFELVATATDPGGLSASTAVSIRLIDVAEPGNDRPVLEDGAVSIPSGAPDGMEVFAVQWTDADPGEVLTWAITGGAADRDGDGVADFAIDADGVIHVADQDEVTTLNAYRRVYLEVTATDQGGLSDAAEVVVTIDYLRPLVGTDGDDVLVGGARRDLIIAGAGDDILEGGRYDDVLRGGEGIDTVRESVWEKLTLTDDRMVGKGVDVLDGIERAELTGSGVGDVIDASGFTRGTVTLDGRGGRDTLIAPQTAGLGYGWEGHVNRLTGGEANDTFVGGTGRDMIYEVDSQRYIVGDGVMSGADQDVFTGIEAVSLIGDSDGASIDVSGFRGERTFLTVYASYNTVVGGAALDMLLSVAPGDVVLTDDDLATPVTGARTSMDAIDAVRLKGFGDVNRFDVAASTAQSIEMIGRGGDDVFIGSDRAAEWVRENADVDFTLTATQLIGLGTDTLTGIDYVRLFGGESARTFDVSAFEGIRTFIHPEGGDDTVIGRAGGIDRVVAYAEGDMVLTDSQLLGQGTVGLTDVDEAAIYALDGAVEFDASAFTRGPVILVGAAGDDVLRGGASSDQLTGGAGDDQLFGGKGWDMVAQQGDVDMVLTDATLTGLGTDALDSIERAHLTGGLGDNTLDASAFTGRMVILEGGWGDDQLIGRAGGADAVMAQADVDFVLTDATLTGLGTDALTDIDEARLYGWSGSNTFDASAFTRGPVRIYAGAGADVLIGGQGADLLDGGEGADAFWLLDPAFGPDELVFAPGQDTLHLAAAAFGGLPAGVLAAERFIDDGSAPATGDAVLLYDAATGALSYDADGAGADAPTLIAMLRDAPALAASDIVVEAWLA